MKIVPKEVLPNGDTICSFEEIDTEVMKIIDTVWKLELEPFRNKRQKYYKYVPKGVKLNTRAARRTMVIGKLIEEYCETITKTVSNDEEDV